MVIITNMLAAVVTFSTVRTAAPLWNVKGIRKLPSITTLASSAVIRTSYDAHLFIPFTHVTVACLKHHIDAGLYFFVSLTNGPSVKSLQHAI